ncbi:hypothetical protein [Clostridium lacusfryxellense]|uniref:hypothetical protein n=1 Tax=Clostridium lacusfryxellense TaxID=205328 RepID=UPI001C0DBFB1|nr:hypothetical protein [Clostridium lacusfryxellense]MBU3110300.1 hypothetical protein [Clostridium lacusfryxellense]
MSDGVEIVVTADTTGATRALDSLHSSMQGVENSINTTHGKLAGFGDKLKTLGGTMSKIGAVATVAITAPLIAMGKKVLDVGSEMKAFHSTFSTVLGDLEAEAKNWSKNVSKEVGLNPDILDKTNLQFINMAKSMGMSTAEALAFGEKMTRLTLDTAAFNDIPIAEAADRMASGLRGEGDAVEKLGIYMGEANLKAQMLSQGLKGNYADLSSAEKANVLYNLGLKQTKDALGQAGRESDSYQNKLANVGNSMALLSEKLFLIVEPAVISVMEKITGLIEKFSALDTGTQKTGLILAGVALVLPPLILGLGLLISAIGTIAGAFATVIPFIKGVGSAFQSLQIMALYVGDAIVAVAGFIGVSVGALIAIVVGIVVAVVLVIKYWDEIKAFTIKAWTSIVSFLKGCLNGFLTFFTGIFDKVKSVITTRVLPVLQSIGSAFKYVFKDIISPILQYFIGFFTAVGQLVVWVVTQVIGGAIKGLGTVFTWLYNVAVKPVLNGIKSAFTSLQTALIPVINAIKSAWSSFANSIRSVWNSVGTPILNGIKTGVSTLGTAWGKTWDTAKTKFSSFVSGIKQLWAGIKTAFKLPHISITGSWNLTPPNISAPKMGVSWHAKGGIFSSPTLLGDGSNGVGEGSSPEAVIPLSQHVLGSIGTAIARFMPDNVGDESGSGGNITNNYNITATIREEADVKKLAVKLYSLQESNRRGRGLSLQV